MTPAAPLPTAEQVRELVASLVGRDTTVQPGDPVVRSSGDAYVGIYASDTTDTAAVVALDLALAGVLGGALGMLPAQRVRDAIAMRSLPANAEENLAEVANIMAGMINSGGSAHVRMTSLVGPDDDGPGLAMALTGAMGGRLDVQVEVEGYGSGRLSVVLAR